VLRGEHAAAPGAELNDDGRRYLLRASSMTRRSGGSGEQAEEGCEDALIELAARAARRQVGRSRAPPDGGEALDATRARQLLATSRSADADLERALPDQHVRRAVLRGGSRIYRGASLRGPGPDSTRGAHCSRAAALSRAAGLEAYTRWLSTHPGRPREGRVLAEADRATAPDELGQATATSPLAEDQQDCGGARRVGKLIRQRP
jgi:hypothetical protein